MANISIEEFFKSNDWGAFIVEWIWTVWRFFLGVEAALTLLACWNGWNAFLWIGKGFIYDGFSSLTDRQLMESTLLNTSLIGVLVIQMIIICFLIWLTYKYHDRIRDFYGRRKQDKRSAK